MIARSRQPLRNLHVRVTVSKVVGVAVDVFRKVRVQIEVVGFALDDADYVARRDRSLKPPAC
jgi:hypothetical protein